MAPSKASPLSKLPPSCTSLETCARVTKKAPRQRTTASKCLKRKDGLLNTAVSVRSEAMAMAKRNSIESPLLRFPAEIRTKIWKYTLGYHRVEIGHRNHKRSWPIGPTLQVYPLHPASRIPRIFVRPNFALPLVCRQAYAEASAYIYTLNTFSFDGRASFDRWLKHRPLGQKSMIASVNMPADYWYPYRRGQRQAFWQKLPNIKRIGVDMTVAIYGRPSLDSDIRTAQERIVKSMHEKEGSHVLIEWHNGVSGAMIFY
ncbi:hypothetical protein FB567DRAFT_61544 [Paraphoma chrysanthemicola]|uniref:Uncharacterized protein n=1 Tax=Paraphoma chrysanthemicola TaxID=798071 RepID=A0A8K0R7A0_9PLEO|nr:hypothetical protein FB567DRAFT_61544 [Paraphoma chrysanthemicola]